MLLLVAVAAWATVAVCEPTTAGPRSSSENSDLRAALAAAEQRAAELEAEVLRLQAAAGTPGGALISNHISSKAEGRSLAARNGTEVSSVGSGAFECHSDEHHSHPHVALIFLFVAVLVGTLMTQVKTLPLFSFLQETVVLFVLGLLFAILMESIGEEKTGVLGESFGMWMRIDPHLLLYTMLPVLLTGDAMSIDTNIARGVANQCMYLAGPGVLINSFLIAFFLWLYLGSIYSGWLDFKLCLVQGSILAATDPVAVVSLLKELGAPPALTVQIAGESLLNDGTAIVLYTIAYDMLKGINFDVAEIVIFLVKTVLCACGLGYTLGNIVVAWIRMAGEKISHDSSKIQISLTLITAYVSFVLAEGVLGISGVLCTVTSSLVLADKMWPAITSREAIEHVWHMFEYVGNTVIFFLAGALTGYTIMTSDDIKGMDYVHLLVLYIVMMAVRGATLFLSLPVLRKLAPAERSKVSMSDAAVITWGGLRGAVGLALAIQVSMTAVDIPALSIKDGKRVLFYTCGIAALTLVVNASTCPLLVRLLEVGRTSGVQRRLIMNIYAHLHEIAETHPKRSTVTRVLKDILLDVQTTIEDSIQDRLKLPGAMSEGWGPGDQDKMVIVSSTGHSRASRRSSASSASRIVMNTEEPAPICRLASKANQTSFSSRTTAIMHGTTLLEKVEARKRAVEMIPNHLCNLLYSMYSGFRLEQQLPVMPMEDCVYEAAKSTVLSQTALRLVHEIFLSLLRAQYQAQIDAKNFSAGSSQVDVLLSSVEHAYTDAWYTLSDFREVKARLKLGELIEEEDDDWSDGMSDNRSGWRSENSDLRRKSEVNDDQGPQSGLACNEPETSKEPLAGDPGTSETAHERQTMTETPEPESRPSINREPERRSRKKISVTGVPARSLRASVVAGVKNPVRKKTIAVRRSSAIEHNEFALNVHFRSALSEEGDEPYLARVVDSKAFQITIVAALLANAGLIVLEHAIRKGNEGEVLWFCSDAVFMLVFTLEFVIKFAALKCSYFGDLWNTFDFALLLFGFLGLIVDGMAFGRSIDNDGDVSSEARLIRLLKVLRALRILRVFRLIHFYHLLKAALARRNLSVQLAENMQTLTVLTAFTSAHTRSQEELIHFFNRGDSKKVAPEVARCVLESQMALYEAILFSAEELKDVDKAIINAMGVLRDCNAAMDHMAHFVHETTEKGILTAHEADIVLHPLQDRMDQFRSELRACELGLLRDDSGLESTDTSSFKKRLPSFTGLKRSKTASSTVGGRETTASPNGNDALVKQAWQLSMALGMGVRNSTHSNLRDSINSMLSEAVGGDDNHNPDEHRPSSVFSDDPDSLRAAGAGRMSNAYALQDESVAVGCYVSKPNDSAGVGGEGRQAWSR